MSMDRQHLSAIPAGTEAGASGSASALRRDVALAVIVGALLLAGVGVGGSLADGQEPLLVRPAAVSQSELQLKFDYFPSQHINQGVEITEDYPTF